MLREPVHRPGIGQQHRRVQHVRVCGRGLGVTIPSLRAGGEAGGSPRRALCGHGNSLADAAPRPLLAGPSTGPGWLAPAAFRRQARRPRGPDAGPPVLADNTTRASRYGSHDVTRRPQATCVSALHAGSHPGDSRSACRPSWSSGPRAHRSPDQNRWSTCVSWAQMWRGSQLRLIGYRWIEHDHAGSIGARCRDRPITPPAERVTSRATRSSQNQVMRVTGTGDICIPPGHTMVLPTRQRRPIPGNFAARGPQPSPPSGSTFHPGI